jgi:bacterioferritin
MKTNVLNYFNNTDNNRFNIVKELFDSSVNSSYESKNIILNGLNIAIADEFLAEYNYFASWNLSKTDGKKDFDVEFKQHENEERKHRYELVNRIIELKATPLTESIFRYAYLNSHGKEWKQELKSNSSEILLNRLNEEKQAIEYYSLFINFVKDTNDVITLKLLKSIRSDEEQHVLDLTNKANKYNLLDDSNNE